MIESLFPVHDEMLGAATFSDCGLYRYRLSRIWSDDLTPRLACFLMLNPSTADAVTPDPTIRKCIGFAKRWGLDGISVVNLFAYRATLPADMRRAADPVGSENDRHVLEAVAAAETVVCAWGPNGTHRGRDRRVLEMIRGICRPVALRLTKDGHPWHPLMAAYSWVPVDFSKGGAR